MPAISFRARRCAVQLGEDGELARAGGRLEHLVGGRHAGGERRDETQLDGRGELLELLALLGPPRVRGRERGKLARAWRAAGHSSPRGRAWPGSGGARRAAGRPRTPHRRPSTPRRLRCRWRRKRPSSPRAACAHRVLRRVPAIPAGWRPPAAIAPRGGRRPDRGSERVGGRRRWRSAWAIREAGGEGGSPDGPLSLAARPDAFLPLASSSPRRPRAAGRRGQQPLT